MLSEDDWDTGAEDSSETEEEEEDYIDIEDILAPPTPTRASKGEGRGPK
jgi:hypothetical protein